MKHGKNCSLEKNAVVRNCETSVMTVLRRGRNIWLQRILRTSSPPHIKQRSRAKSPIVFFYQDLVCWSSQAPKKSCEKNPLPLIFGFVRLYYWYRPVYTPKNELKKWIFPEIISTGMDNHTSMDYLPKKNEPNRGKISKKLTEQTRQT